MVAQESVKRWQAGEQGLQAHIQAEKRRAEAELQAERGRAAAELQAEKRRAEDQVEEEKRRSEQALEAERRRAEGELEAERRRWQKESEAEKRRSDDALQAERRRAEEDVDAEKRRWGNECDSAPRKVEAGQLVAKSRTEELGGDKTSESEVEAAQKRRAGPLHAEVELDAERTERLTLGSADHMPRGRALAPQNALSTAARGEAPPSRDTPVSERAPQSEGKAVHRVAAAVPAPARHVPQGKPVESTLDRQASPRTALRTRTCQSQTEPPGHVRASTQTARTCTVSTQVQTLRPNSLSKWAQTPPLDTVPVNACHSACPAPATAIDHATQVAGEPLEVRKGPEANVGNGEVAGGETQPDSAVPRHPELPDKATQTSECASLHKAVPHVAPLGSATCVQASPTLCGMEGVKAASADPPGGRLGQRQGFAGKVKGETDAESPDGNDCTAVEGSDAGSRGDDLRRPDALSPVHSRPLRAQSWVKDREDFLEWAYGVPDLDSRDIRSSLEEAAQYRDLAEERRLQLEAAYAELEVCTMCPHVHCCLR